MRNSTISTVAVVMGAFALVGCGPDSSPTGTSPVPTQFSAAPSSTGVSTSARGSSVARSTDASVLPNSFTCADVQDNIKVRFSQPGFVIGPVVSLFVEYKGIPVPGDKFLDIWWDEVNKPGEVENLNVGAGDPQSHDSAKFDLKGIVAWVYDDLERPEQRQIRVNLRVAGRDGECARVRRVHVEPGPSLGLGGARPGLGLGLVLDAKVTTPVAGSFSASATVTNNGGASVTGVKIAFATPPGFNVASTCQSGSSGGGIVICNIGGALLPGATSTPHTIGYSTQTIAGGLPVPGAIAVLRGAAFGRVFEYVVSTGKGMGTTGVTNLREIAR